MFKYLMMISLCLSIGMFASEDQLLNRTLVYAKGHQEFRGLFFKQHEKEFLRLVNEGQTPRALFICCSDSRVVPSLILGARPGDLFIARNAGNFVPLYDQQIAWDGIASTIEYAVEVLNVKDIIVCGHSHCGAIKGLFQPLDDPKFALIKKWLRFGEQAKEITKKNCVREDSDEECYAVAERISVISQLDHLMTFPFVKKRVDDKTITLHGWYYVIETGKIFYFDPDENNFFPLAQ